MSAIETPSENGQLAPSLLQIADLFARYGNFTLGGGNATTAALHRELVDRRHWLKNDVFALCFALGRLTPGTNVLAFSAGVGWTLRRMPGAIVALLAASVPSSIMVIVLTALFRQWQGNGTVKLALHGAVAAAVAITAKTSWTIAKPHYQSGERLRVVLIGGAAFALYVGLGLPAIEVLILAGIGGALMPVTRS